MPNQAYLNELVTLARSRGMFCDVYCDHIVVFTQDGSFAYEPEDFDINIKGTPTPVEDEDLAFRIAYQAALEGNYVVVCRAGSGDAVLTREQVRQAQDKAGRVLDEYHGVRRALMACEDPWAVLGLLKEYMGDE